MDLLLIAWRYLVARPITLVSMLSVTVGLVAIVVVDSVMSGFLNEQRSNIRGLSPDVTVTVDALDEAAIATLLAQLRADPGVVSAEPRAEAAAMHRGAGTTAYLGADRIGQSYFVNLLGMEPAELVDGLRGSLAPTVVPAGSEVHAEVRRFLATSNVMRPDDPFWFDPADPHWRDRMPPDARFRDDLTPILFGRHLAATFQYWPGTVVSIATLAGELRDGARLAVRTRDFVVVGTFSSGDRSFDDTHALVPRERLVDFAALAHPVQEIALDVAGEPAAARDRLRAALAATGVPPDAIETWEDRRHLLLGAVLGERRVMNVAMFFVVIVATFSLFVTLHQMVRRKTRDIGVLVALGAPAMHAGRLFLLCGLLVTLAGSLLGLFGGIALAHWLNPLLDLVERISGFRLFDRNLFSFKSLPVQIEFGRLLGYTAASVVCGTLFTLLPAWRAARLDPVEALRHE